MISINAELPEIWNHYIDRHPDSNFCHLYEWGDLLRKVLGFKKYYLSYREKGRIAGVLPLSLMESPIFGKKLYSLPVVDYGGVLANSKKAEQELLRSAKILARSLKVRFLELRHFEEKPWPGSLCRTDKVTFLCDLNQTEEALWKTFKAGSIRTPIRKALQEGFTIEFGKEKFLRDFYKIFCQTMLTHGTPVYPFSLFQKILITFPHYADIALVRHRGIPCAAGLILSYKGFAECPFAGSIAYGAIRPNDLMYWEILKFCKARGNHTFDFGRSSKESGTYRFKKKWTRDIRQIYWQYYLVEDRDIPVMGESNSFQSKVISIWKKLPLPLANLLGPIVSRNIP